jgi:ABC-type antimicrobial peptide transport system permease subunit
MVIEIFLVVIGAFLIYSLLLADVEAKVYECGMLRALGMEQYTLIALLSIQV